MTAMAGFEPQLLALTLIDAYREGRVEDARLMQETVSAELFVGLLRLCASMLSSMAAGNGLSEVEMTAMYRRWMLTEVSP